MGIAEEIKEEVLKIFQQQWSIRDGNKVPESEDLKLDNDSVQLDGTVLYADLSGSTALVDKHKAHFAAEIYKAFLHCAARVIRNEGGVITAYDGDRIMAVFIGESKNTSAARAALRINWAREEVINPAIKAQYPDSTFKLNHVTAVDTSKLIIARTGVRGANDLVWVGRAANHAAKMAALTPDSPSRITAEVFNNMHASAKYHQSQLMWEQINWTETGRSIYRSNWMWGP